ncbi:MAG: 7,8-dihydro-6-hydroxymethylpterin-pyrophosphokinase [Alphaproteobacteria bacterium]|nr:MAG: 7,8-dihydro-6-hydroxymethylpterin-pyrophosphokinase [Alphaproteobacteria bacterium]
MKNNHNIVYLGLGSNLRLSSYRNAMKVIESLKKKIYKSGLRITKSSNYWLTYPIPFSNIPKFINCVVKCIIVSKKANNPVILLKYLKTLEIEIGRKKKNNNISRLIDIDILDFKGKIINEGLILPHPRMHCRKFVLNPMKKIAPNWKHPVYEKKIDFFITKIKSQQILIKK